jgi:hypothetical protein
MSVWPRGTVEGAGELPSRATSGRSLVHHVRRRGSGIVGARRHRANTSFARRPTPIVTRYGVMGRELRAESYEL